MYLRATGKDNEKKLDYYIDLPPAGLQIAPENAGNRISEALKLKIFRRSMPPDPPRDYRLRRAFIRTPLRQILDPPQQPK